MLRGVIICPLSSGIYHLEHPDNRYLFTFQDGLAECEAHGMQMASLDQLTEAFHQGYELCSCGWNSDGWARYPMHQYVSGCGHAPTINGCSNYGTWNVFCYRE